MTPHDCPLAYTDLPPQWQRVARCLEGAANAGPRITDEHRNACYEALQQAGYPLGEPLSHSTRGAGTPGECGRPGY